MWCFMLEEFLMRCPCSVEIFMKRFLMTSVVVVIKSVVRLIVLPEVINTMACMLCPIVVEMSKVLVFSLKSKTVSMSVTLMME